MAVIGKIQKNSLLLLIVIGLAMLAFIFTDFIKNSNDEIEDLPMGTVYGEPIDVNEYNELSEVFENRERMNAQYQQREFTEQDKRMAQDQAFNEVIRRVIMNTEFDKLGLETTTDELNDMIHGNHIHPWVMQVPNFNGTQGFSRDSVKKFIQQLDMEPENPEARENWIALRKQWSEFENELKSTRAADKYVTLIKKGLYVNSIEAKDMYLAQTEKKKVRFVVQRYADIPEDEVTITDEEIEAYFEEHKNDPEFEQIEARELDFVQFPVLPTAADQMELANQMENIKENFKTTPNNLFFISQNTENGFINDSMYFNYGQNDLFSIPQGYFAQAQYPASIDDQIQAADSGDVIGPVVSGGEVVLAKVTGGKKEEQAWVRHILISNGTRSDEQAKVIADSVIAIIKANNNFPAMVQQFSDDPGSKATGGEYKWFPKGRMVAEFENASFNGVIGDLQLVKTTYGYHIVEVLGRAERFVPKLALVSKMVRPSDQTLEDVENMVYDFIYNIKESGEDSAFYKISADSNLTVLTTRVYLTSQNVNGFEKPDRLLKFAFNRKSNEGDISDPILDKGMYSVAILTNKIEEGAPEFRDVKERMRFPALQEKQAQHYIEKLSGMSSLEEIAQNVVNGVITTADVTFATNSIQGGGGNEPKVIGQLFTNIPDGKLTLPLQGKTGVYVFQIESTTPAPETSDYSVQVAGMKIQRQNAADNQVIKALREKADVEDNRRKREFSM